jgi:hypothetical protein
MSAKSISFWNFEKRGGLDFPMINAEQLIRQVEQVDASMNSYTFESKEIFAIKFRNVRPLTA